MARVDATFGPGGVIGWQLDRLPTFSDLKTTYSDGYEIDVEGYIQVFAGVSGARTAPSASGEWRRSSPVPLVSGPPAVPPAPP